MKSVKYHYPSDPSYFFDIKDIILERLSAKTD